jgi:hypothetical protein
MTNGTALAVRNGGSPRIHAGELGFQAERLAQNYSPPASAAGFCLSAHALKTNAPPPTRRETLMPRSHRLSPANSARDSSQAGRKDGPVLRSDECGEL